MPYAVDLTVPPAFAVAQELNNLDKHYMSGHPDMLHS
jgi:hypothetical protein